jgi:hypothetical protein
VGDALINVMSVRGAMLAMLALIAQDAGAYSACRISLAPAVRGLGLCTAPVAIARASRHAAGGARGRAVPRPMLSSDGADRLAYPL